MVKDTNTIYIQRGDTKYPHRFYIYPNTEDEMVLNTLVINEEDMSFIKHKFLRLKEIDFTSYNDFSIDDTNLLLDLLEDMLKGLKKSSDIDFLSYLIKFIYTIVQSGYGITLDSNL